MGRTTLPKTWCGKPRLSAQARSRHASYPAHATPASAGNTVKGLYEVLLTAMKNGRILGPKRALDATESGHSPKLRRRLDGAAVGRPHPGPV
jgi:hypothetical protein